MIEKKHSLFEIIVGVAAIVACVAALLDIPDIRRWIGLDPANSPETPTPMVSTQASGQPIQTLEASPTLIEKVQTPPVVIQTRDISTAPNPTMSGSVSALVTIANQKCQEFGGTPKPANNITSAQISNGELGRLTSQPWAESFIAKYIKSLDMSVSLKVMLFQKMPSLQPI